MIRASFYHTFIFSLCICVSSLVCTSNNAGQQQKQETVSNVTSGQRSISRLYYIPGLSRELIQENDSFYADEDCFCSSRVLVFDTNTKNLNVFSWCRYKESPANDPDFGIYTFEKVLPDSSVQFQSNSGASNEFQCIQLKTSGADSLMTLLDCTNQKKYFFTSMRLLNNYEVRVPDCSDVQG